MFSPFGHKMDHTVSSVMSERQKLAQLLRKCSRNSFLDKGKEVHGAVVRNGYGSDLIVNNDLIDMYGKCGRMNNAYTVFDQMAQRNVVSWTSLMCGYLQEGNANASLSLFHRMGFSVVKPNEYTFSTNIKACTILGVPENGMQIHGSCTKNGFKGYPVVGNSIIDMYSRCRKISEAEQMFLEMPYRSLISWNVMITGYCFFEDMCDKSLLLFKEMQKQGEIPDEYTFASTLKACRGLEAFQEGRQIHASLIAKGCPITVQDVIAGALIDLYVQCGHLFEAQKVFDQMETKSAVSWMRLIIGYAQCGNLSQAMELLKQLRESHIPVDGFVLSSVISVFGDFALLELGKQMHSYAIKIPFGFDTSVANSIMDMYLKCGLTEEAERVFVDTPEKNVISYTVMITGCGKYGLGKEAINVFEDMRQGNIEPDEVTYLALLSACSHSGLVEESQRYFTQLCNSHRIKPRVEHYACMVDILGRAGLLKEARNLIQKMPVRPNIGIWQTLLSACRVHKNVEIGREVGEILLTLDGDNPVNYVLLSNIFADALFWKDRERLRGLMKAKGLKKEAGRSWVEIEREMHFFYNGDETHPLTREIHEILKEMEKKMKEAMGYACEVRYALHDVEEESKEENLRVHSEKLAIGLALVCGGMQKEGQGQPIRIFKNLRVCGDCHEYIKGLSKILGKVFLVRDANRFHKFQSGVCSCGDYW